MERCLDMVDGAKPNSSVIWQTHSSRRRSARRIRTRLGSDSALVTAMNSRIDCYFVKQLNEYRAGAGCRQAEFLEQAPRAHPAGETVRSSAFKRYRTKLCRIW